MKYKKGDLVIWQHGKNTPKMKAKVKGKNPHDVRYPVVIEFTEDYSGNYMKGDTLPASESELTLQSKLEKALQ